MNYIDEPDNIIALFCKAVQGDVRDAMYWMGRCYEEDADADVEQDAVETAKCFALAKGG